VKCLLKFKLAFVFFVFSLNAAALDDLSTISEDTKKILLSMEVEFGLKDLSISKKKIISEKFEFALKGHWYSYWIGNDDLQDSKLKDSKVRIYDLFVVDESRIYNISFTYFPEAKQIYVIQKQYIEGSSDALLKAFNEHKVKEKTIILKETDSYAFTRTEGYMDFDVFHSKAPNGLAAYIDASVIDLK